MYEQILYDVEDPIATITLNRPAQLNAWTNRMAAEVKHAVAAAESDPRVVVMERTNVLHAPPPEQDIVDLVVIDLGWTQQRHAIPAALQWLSRSPHARIITLVKPHYELDEQEKKTLLHEGRLDPADAERITQRTLAHMPSWGVQPLAHTRSPITGGKSSKGRSGAGNIEYLVLARRVDADAP